jgi:hypothetical protein
MNISTETTPRHETGIRRKNHKPKILIVTTLVCFFAVAVPYWLIPYGNTDLPSSLSDISLILLAAGAFWVRVKEAVDFWMGTSFMGITVPGAVMVRVIVEGIQDPTSHNLWPFELVIAVFFGYIWALGGSVAGHFYLKTKGGGSRSSAVHT